MSTRPYRHLDGCLLSSPHVVPFDCEIPNDELKPIGSPRPYRHMRLDTERAWCRVLLSSDNRAATTVRSEVGCAPCLAALDRAAAENAGVAP